MKMLLSRTNAMNGDDDAEDDDADGLSSANCHLAAGAVEGDGQAVAVDDDDDDDDDDAAAN
jgi:hypothetical protein